MRVGQVILSKQAGLNRSEQLVHVRKELVDTDIVLKKAPEAFDEIERGAVRRQPKDPQAMFKETEGGQGRRTLVIRCIVQDQNERASRVRLDQELFKESNEMLTVLTLRR